MSNRNKLVTLVEAEVTNKKIPYFKSGDTVVVNVKVKDGNRERVQAFEGVVIAIKSRGAGSSFLVRKVAHGVGVERTFQTYSPLIDSIDIVRRGKVRQSKIYYLRERSGRSARIREDLKRMSEDQRSRQKTKKVSKKVSKKVEQNAEQQQD